jgi:hypothetical protein
VELHKAQWHPQPAVAPGGAFKFTIGKIYEKGQIVSPENLQTAKQIEDRLELIKSRTLTMYHYGEITYQDVSGRQHTTTFCIFLANPETKELAFCTDFNDIE